MIDHIKIGAFLKELRKEKELTQEQLATKFGVSSRSVSRWENGNTLPELSVLVELADFYEVDIKEIIDGGRKSDTLKQEKETLLKVADYAKAEKKLVANHKCTVAFVVVSVLLLILILSPRAIHLIQKYHSPEIKITHTMYSTTSSLPNPNRQIAIVSVKTYNNLPLPSKIRRIVRETETVFAQANADVVSDEYIEPTVIKVSGETKDGKTYIYYTGTVTTKDGKTKDYYNEIVLDYSFECQWYLSQETEK